MKLKLYFFIFLTLVIQVGCSGEDSSSLRGSDLVAGGSGASLDLFKGELHTDLVATCGGCHGASQSPLFAVESGDEAFATVQTAGLIDYANYKNSRFLAKIATNHNCGGADKCGVFKDRVESLLKTIVEAGKDEGLAKDDLKFKTAAKKFKNAVKKDYIVPNKFFVYEAEEFSNPDMAQGEESSATVLDYYVSAKPEAERPQIILGPKLEGDYLLYLWVRYKSNGTGNLNVNLNLEDLGDFGDNLPNTNGKWEWAVFNTAESLIEIGGSNSIVISPNNPEIKIDKIVLTNQEGVPDLKKSVLSFDISSLLGVPARIEVVAQTLDDKTEYRVGEPVLFTSEDVSVEIKNMRVFFNGENKTNESTFKDIDIITSGGPTVLSTATQSIPFPEGGKKNSDEIYLGFEALEKR